MKMELGKGEGEGEVGNRKGQKRQVVSSLSGSGSSGCGFRIG